jgi:hypothetical protein
MKRFILSLLITTTFILLDVKQSNAQYLQYEPASPVSNQKLQNGWYSATVIVHNMGTGSKSRYSLKVKVEYNRVVMIDFGNDGSVHSGYNNSGYYYLGGDLNYENDSNGDLTSVTAEVSVVDKSAITRKFYIDIS